MKLDMRFHESEQRFSLGLDSDDARLSLGFGAFVAVGGTGGNLPLGGKSGDLLAKNADGDYAVTWVTPADSPEQDNTRPITAAAVYKEVGNINALLATI